MEQEQFVGFYVSQAETLVCVVDGLVFGPLRFARQARCITPDRHGRFPDYRHPLVWGAGCALGNFRLADSSAPHPVPLSSVANRQFRGGNHQQGSAAGLNYGSEAPDGCLRS